MISDPVIEQKFLDLANNATFDDLRMIPQEMVNAAYRVPHDHKPWVRRLLYMAIYWARENQKEPAA